MISAHTQKLLDEKKYTLERVTGKDMQGQDIFAYVLLRKSHLKDFAAALKTRDVNLSEFGVVLAHGVGENIPEGLEAQIIGALQAD